MPNNQTHTDNTLSFTASGASLYQLKASVHPLDVIDQLTAQLGQLSAMLSTVTGEGIDNFLSLSQHTQNRYLWGCQRLSDECRELATHLSPLLRTGRGETHEGEGNRQSGALACLEAMRQLEADAKEMPEDPRAWLLKRLTDSERVAQSFGPLSPEAEGAILALAEYVHYANTTGLPRLAPGAWKPVAAMNEGEINGWVAQTEREAREDASGPRTQES